MIAWLNPAALAALALLAGPVLVHLLLRHRAERVMFPSLRFVRPSRTAAVRLRLPSDVGLLLLRVAIVALAVAALAQPLLLARPRLDAWNGRLARATVVDVSDSMSTAQSAAAAAAKAEAQGTVFAIRLDASELRSGVRQAVERLAAAPPGRREIVIVSDFQRGALSRADLDAVPAAIGIRLVQVGGAAKERRVRGLDLFQPGHAPTQDILLAGPATSVTVGPGTATAFQVRPKPDATELRLVSGEAGGVALEKLQRAVAAAGAPAPSPAQPLTIVFAGAPWGETVHQISGIWMLETVLRMRNDPDLVTACSDSGMPSLAGVSEPLVTSGFSRTMPLLKPSPGSRRPGAASRASDRTGTAWHVLCRDSQSRPVVRAAAAGPQLVLDVDAPPSALLSAAVVRAALTARYGSVARPEEEVQTMTGAELTAWSRAPLPVAADAWRSGLESDARWCWALALVLLAVESAIRGRKTGRLDAPHEARADAA